jgi:sugar lactone lactonase YvrE
VKPFPAVIPLPAGWSPEGIATGKGTSFYVGSLATGSVYKGDLRTGKGKPVVTQSGRMAVGLKVDNRNRIFVAGGSTGQAYVYGANGTELKAYELTAPSADPNTPTTFINDVALTRAAAWFTNSMVSDLYRVDIAGGGALATSAVKVTLSGDYAPAAGFNINGIAATPNGKWLVIVQTATGKLYRVDPATGATKLIALAGGATVPNGDGILLAGKTLYVVQNQMNKIAVVKLSADLLSGEITSTITDPDLDWPTTVARFGNSLYAVNARFGTAAGPSVAYDVVKLPRK